MWDSTGAWTIRITNASILPEYAPGAIIFYDISNHVTFLNAKELLNKEGTQKYANTNVVIMLCFGRSVDLQCHKNMPSSEVVK